MKLSIISFKECWQDENGAWVSYGGFPAQMEVVSSLFDETEMVVCAGKPRSGAMALPRNARVIALKNPPGRGLRRKIAVLLRSGSYFREISRSVKNADAVHTPVPGDIALLGLISALWHRKRLIARYCVSWKDSAYKTMTKAFTRALMARSAGGRNVMLATGSYEEPPAPGMHWIFATAYTKSEVEALQPDLDRGLSSPARLVYAGRLAEGKKVNHLLKAMAALRDSGVSPLPLLTVAGEGPERKRLEALARKLQIESNVKFTGQVNREELSRLMLDADLYVHTSFSEGMCKAWIDAMAHGLPVVAYDVGGAPVVLGGPGERGWFVPVGDLDAFTQKLRDVLTQPLDWAALRRRCREHGRSITLESWGATIGSLCAASWGVELRDGKLRNGR